MLNHIKNLGIHVTPEDKQRWNTAAEKSSGKDIDIDEYSTTEEVKQLIKDYVDNQGFITDIPEYYETEEEVLLLLNTTLGNYTRSEDLDETLAQYTTLAALDDFEQAIYDYLEQFKQDVLEDTKYVTAMQFSDVSRDLTLTQSDGTTLSVNIPGGGGGSSVSAYLMMEAIAYCNVSSDVTPATPEGGSYNFNTYILTPPHDPTVGSTVVWANSQNGMTVDSTHSIYISKRVFSSDPDAPATSWSQPLLYSGSIQTETSNVHVYSTEVAKVFTVYCEGTVQKITDPVSGEISYKSVPPSNVSHAPEGGTYDRANDTLSSNPHTYGVPSEYWTLNRPVIPGTWTDPDTEQSEEPVTFSKACYFSIGTVKSDNSLEWSAPSIYGIDYVVQASKIKLNAVELAVVAENVALNANDLAIVAQNVELTPTQLSIIAEQVSVDAAFTTFRGDVSATSFSVFKDNAYYEEVTDPETQETSVVKKTDVDQKLFSIALNEHDNTTYDPTSANDDVLMLFYNPGTLTDHIQGDPTEGGGQKGTLTGNVLTYALNPKRLAQSIGSSYSCRVPTQDDSTDTMAEYLIGGEHPASITDGTYSHDVIDNSILYTFPEKVKKGIVTGNTLTLPDPKMYCGTVINGTIDVTLFLHGHSYYPNAVDISNSVDGITGVFDNCLMHIYNYHPYQLESSIYATWQELCEQGLPRIDIDPTSSFRFFQLNAADDATLRDNQILEYRCTGLHSLDKDFYKGLGNIVVPQAFNGLKYTTHSEDTAKYPDPSTYTWDEHMDYLGESGGIYLLPTPIGLQKMYEGFPLTFKATAVNVHVNNLEQSTSHTLCEGSIYYWDIRTEDFIMYGDQEYSDSTYASIFRLKSFDVDDETDGDVTISITSPNAPTTQFGQQEVYFNQDVAVQSPAKLLMLLAELEESKANQPVYIQNLIDSTITEQSNV